MKLRFLTLFILSITFSTFSQETTIEDTTLKGQFDKIYRTSTNYQVYKVISREKYLKLKQNVLDSLKKTKMLIIEKENLLSQEKESVKKTQEILSKTKLDLDLANQKENSISLFGLQLKKVTYNLILCGSIVALLIGLIFFIFKFLKSNILTKEAQDNLLVVEQEFDQHRKKSLEREQKLRRQLQDEINKQRNI